MKRSDALASAALIVVGGGFVAYGLDHPKAVSPAAVSAGDEEAAVPDFSSNGVVWRLDCRKPDGSECATNTEFLKVPGDTGPGPVMQHPKYPYEHNENKRMADTSNPILQPWVKAKMDKEVDRIIAGGFPFISTSRCWPGGVPGIHLYTGYVKILQTKDTVWIMQERDGPRRVYMNAPHSKDPAYSWYGESVGHYENGKTLVVDTIGLDDKGPVDRLNTPHTKQLHVIERYTLLDNGRMRVTFTVEDPGAYTQPWMAMVEYAKGTQRGQPDVPAEWEEYICNENSTEYFMPEGSLVPVPSATKRDF
jgi:hypothetical protein